MSDVSAAQTECSQSDSGDVEGSAGVYGAGALPSPLADSVQGHDLITSLYLLKHRVFMFTRSKFAIVASVLSSF